MDIQSSGLLQAIASMATAIGVAFAAFQLWQTLRQAQTTFEDALAREYRDIASSLPTAALLGEPLSATIIEDSLDEFYRYFDLSNGQIFFRQVGRVSRGTWEFWCDGIRSNVQRPAFNAAWTNISTRAPHDFSEMRRLIRENFQVDPRSWN